MRYFFLLFSFVIAVSVSGQTTQLDSLFDLIKNHRGDDTVRVNTLNELSNQYQWSDFYRSLHYAEQSLKLAQQIGYQKGMAEAYYRKGHSHWALGDSNFAIEMGLAAVNIAEKEHFNLILAEGYQVLARAYMDQRESEKSLFYINNAERLAVQTGNQDLLSRVFNLAGVIQFIAHKQDSALQLYSKALFIARKYSTPRIHWARIMSNIGECYLKSNPDVSFEYFNNALAIARETNNRTAEAGISSIIGTALVKMEDFRKAEGYLQSALLISRELGLKRVMKNAYSSLADLRIREGKSAEALQYMKNYYETKENLLSVSKTRQIVELEARYELEKKQQAIKLLEQEKHIERIWKNIFIAIVVLLAIFSVAIYCLQRYRQNKNLQILNLEIDHLNAQHKEISQKYRSTFGNNGDEKIIESHDQRLLKRAIEIVEDNITDSLFGVESLAQEMGMSRSNMHRKIKKISGFAPSELIRNIRLRRAAVLLANQADSVSQIGIMVGFEDHSYFSKSFKKHFGIPPSEYHSSISRQENNDKMEGGMKLPIEQDGELVPM